MKKYKFTLDQLNEFAKYLTHCIMHITDKEKSTDSGIIHYNLNTIRGECAIKMLQCQIKQKSTIQMKFDYGELLTLSYCFKQWEVPPFLRGIEFNLIGAL